MDCLLNTKIDKSGKYEVCEYLDTDNQETYYVVLEVEKNG